MFSNITKTLTTPIERLGSPLSLTTKSSSDQTPWHAAFPAPRHQPAHIPDVDREDVLALFKEGKRPGGRAKGGFLLVDVRRNDHEVSPGVSSMSGC